MKKEDSEKLVSVYKTGNPAIVAMIKSILDEAEIKYLVKGENLQNLFGIGTIGTGYNLVTGPVDFQVMPEDEQYARELLSNISENSDYQDETEQ